MRYVLLIAMLAGTVIAQDSTNDALLHAASLASAGDHRAAVAVLRSAHASAPSARVDLNLAISLAEVGSLWEAHELLSRLVTRAANPLLVEIAREQLRDIDSRLPELVLRVRGAPPDGLRAVLDGERQLRLQDALLRLRLDPGPHRLELRSDDRELSRETFTLAEGQHRDLWLGPFAPFAPSAILEQPRPASPWILAAAIGGAILTAMTIVALLVLVQ
jgi:hypothetical protein